MNKILNKLIDEQTPEQVQQAFDKIKKERGYCPNDVSVEEALGFYVEVDVTYQRFKN
jgi:acid phosphatase family membrane protein YuiD